MAGRIDSHDPLHKYGTNAGEICESELPFYPGARLLRVTSRTPAIGSRYFIRHGDDLVSLYRLPEVRSYCDGHFGLVLDSTTALDYFRFAHFFSGEGLKTSLVEAPQDLRMDPRSYNPEHRRASAFIKPPEIMRDEGGLTASACTFDDRRSLLYRDRYQLRPGQELQLLERRDSGIDLGKPFHDLQLKIGRSDLAHSD